LSREDGGAWLPAGGSAGPALNPGTKILEEAIAEQFEASCIVVRGALGVLGSDHLLEGKRTGGTFVAEPSIERAKTCSMPA